MSRRNKNKGKYSAWDLFYLRAKPIIYKMYGPNHRSSIEKIEKAFLKLSVETPIVDPNHYDKMMTRLLDLLELNKKASLDNFMEEIMNQYYCPN